MHQFLLIALLGLLWGVEAQAEPVAGQPPAAVELPTGPVILRGLALPEQLAGFRRGSMRDYEKQSPGLGWSVAYHRSEPRTTATVYIYGQYVHLRLANAAYVAESERDEAVREIEAVVRRGLYERADVLERGRVQPSASASGLAFAALRLVRQGEDHDSYVFVTVQRGSFVKVRVTSSSHPGSRAAAIAFASEVARLAD